MENVLSVTRYSWPQRLARQQVFNLLSDLDNAAITFHEHGQHSTFGEASAELHAHIEVLDPRFYTRLLFGGSIGAGEAWAEGLWTTDDLAAVIRVCARSQVLIDKLEKRLAWLSFPMNKISHWLRRNTRSSSRANIAAHYDIGNDMYELFLDGHMQYSSAIYPHQEAELAEAQEHKLKLICDKLELKAHEHLIEIGTGWGGLACYAAKHYGCKVTTTTLSQAQYDIAKQRIEEQGLQDKVTLLLKDYRDLEGQYDKLVSIEMIEAVGYEFLSTYFATLNRLLLPHGKMLIQAITINDQRFDKYVKEVDFIQKHIFPGGCLPSLSVMCDKLKQQTDMTVTQLSSYGHDYAQTLRDWAHNFSNAGQQLSQLGYGEQFQRLWQFYFAYCEGGFDEGCINLVHFEAAKPQALTVREG